MARNLGFSESNDLRKPVGFFTKPFYEAAGPLPPIVISGGFFGAPINLAEHTIHGFAWGYSFYNPTYRGLISLHLKHLKAGDFRGLPWIRIQGVVSFTFHFATRLQVMQIWWWIALMVWKVVEFPLFFLGTLRIFGRVWTCMTQGCIGPQNSHIWGVRILRGELIL